MNAEQLKQIIAIAQFGSFSKAANAIFSTQSTLSRTVKKAEAEYDIKIFRRKHDGVELTDDGIKFFDLANNIIRAEDELDSTFSSLRNNIPELRVSMIRSSYSSYVMSRFLEVNTKKPIKVLYKEADTRTTIENIAQNGYDIGMIRFDKRYEKHMSNKLFAKGITYRKLSELKYFVLCSKYSELAKQEGLSLNDVQDYTELLFSDQRSTHEKAYLSMREQLQSQLDNQVFLYERSAEYEILSRNPNTFKVVSKPRREILKAYDLTCVEIIDNDCIFCDCIIFKIGTHFTPLQTVYINCIKEAVKLILENE